ncbi:hypothetical protein BDN67DRAFT_1016869 [Paxillus ammoniavirescens]|nr:hypothetical protein BDN67DRAFT_1016869 [Paxillus ammoniavirescens]
MLHLKNTTLYHSLYPRITGIVFLQNLSQLVAMVPYEIHELAMNNFSEHVCDLLQPFRLSNDMDVMAIINGNLAISDGDFEVVPDFRLSLCSLHNYGGQALIPWWSVFPNMQMDTVNQLLNLATKHLFLKITSMMEEWYNQLPPVNNSNDPPPGGPGGPGPGGLGPGGPGSPGIPGPSRKWPSTPEPGPSTSHHSSSRGQQGKSHKRHRSGKKAS